MLWKPTLKGKSQIKTAPRAVTETAIKTTRRKGNANTGIMGIVNPRMNANSHILKPIAVIQTVPTKHALIGIGKHERTFPELGIASLGSHANSHTRRVLR